MILSLTWLTGSSFKENGRALVHFKCQKIPAMRKSVQAFERRRVRFNVHTVKGKAEDCIGVAFPDLAV
jgi:hypothetical protein